MERIARKVDTETQEALRKCHIQNNLLYLPEQLSPELYKKVKQVLLALDAKWNKHLGAHELEYDISQELERIQDTGIYYDWKRDSQYYPTPREVLRVADHFIPYEYDDPIQILEPSAGKGAILDFLKEEFPKAEKGLKEKAAERAKKLDCE